MTSDPSKLSATETIKADSHLLRGTIAQEMADTSTGAISEPNGQLTKFHGLYLAGRPRSAPRPEEGRQGKGLRLHAPRAAARRPGHAAAVARARPACRRSRLAFPAPHHAPDLPVSRRAQGQRQKADQGHAPGAARFDRGLRRREPQRHGAAQSRSAARFSSRSTIRRKAWSEFALPKTHAYHEIWLDDEIVAGGERKPSRCTARPICRANSRPASPCRPHNDVDIFSQDLGFIAIVGKRQARRLQRHRRRRPGHEPRQRGNLSAPGRRARLHPGRQGQSPSARRSSPRSAITATGPTASMRGSSTPSRTAASTWFKAEVEKRSGVTFEPARPFHFTTIEDPHGWHECADGTWFYGLHILSGRIKDLPGWPMKTALREIAQIHTGDFRLTPSQNLSISGVTAAQKPRHRRDSRPARPDRGEQALAACGSTRSPAWRCRPAAWPSPKANGLCPTSWQNLKPSSTKPACKTTPSACASPAARTAARGPISRRSALVGKAPNKYALYLGAKYNGTRLNRLFAATVTIDEAVDAAHARSSSATPSSGTTGEGFGDFCDREILPEGRDLPQRRHAAGSRVELKRVPLRPIDWLEAIR